MTCSFKLNNCNKVIIFGYYLLMVFFTIAICSILYDVQAREQLKFGHVTFLRHTWENISLRTVDIVCGTIAVISGFGIIFTTLLLIGIYKKKAGLVLSYFCFGCLLTIILIIVPLLLMIQSFWKLAIYLMLKLFIHTNGLSYVYKAYVDMDEASDTIPLIDDV